MDASLAGHTVHLEAPDELRGLLKEDDTSPFVAEEDAPRGPTVRRSRTRRRPELDPALAQPYRNLKDELLERPLLSVFRFVRFRVYYVASPDCDTKCIRYTSSVPIFCQVLSYAIASKIALVDDINLLLEPDSGFVCLEFLLGYCPRNQVAGNPADFSRLWSTISFAGASGAAVVRDRLAAAFQPPGGGSRSTVDLGEQAVAYISPRGEKTASVPVVFVVTLTAPRPYDDTAPGSIRLSGRTDLRHRPRPPALLVLDQHPTRTRPRCHLATTPTDATATLLEALMDQQRRVSATTEALARQVATMTSLVRDQRQTPTLHAAALAGGQALLRAPMAHDDGADVVDDPPHSIKTLKIARLPLSFPAHDSFRRSRSRSRDGSPRGHRPSGANIFRPSKNEAIIHYTVRIGPRQLNPDTGNAGFPRFTNMSAHDRACFMLQHERFRGRYRVTKVAVKMLYAVNFGSRPFNHFLSSEGPGMFYQDRSIVHDDTQWSGPEPSQRFQIRRADQLHQVLHVIQEAAAEWYPSDLAMVFRSVHGDALHSVPQRSPSQVVHARCNLYQAVFGELFQDILNVCVRYQTATGLSFPRCPHVHRLHNLPSDVLQWIADHHGALKGGHPQHT
ncbi:hypothetical protein PHMEG_00022385 [Phytophthora megakarya]|uniref:Uncharacterized protein n=1 Tax=Phytophthora megakarya TaxID=4795 RepID=A0A225VIV9_9STRA|nr:hypothetical protein PHMEG_00022385 [Phytophthora megakarya]